ncbi:hypothetical protein [Caulobacter vibrioides]|uniref:hypothetical protein n=1 Tax=Caulobacter vibrioides TaxID=155892 RepID=UPI0015E7928B|nr:hypothetical protein [Caulobacter vibrioides]
MRPLILTFAAALLIGLVPVAAQSIEKDLKTIRVADEAALVAYEKGDLQEAMSQLLILEHYAAIYKLAPTHPGVAGPQLRRADVLLAMGRLTDAEAMAEGVVKVLTTSPNPDYAELNSVQICRGRATLAESAFARQRFDRALTYGRLAYQDSRVSGDACLARGKLVEHLALRVTGRGGEAESLSTPPAPLTQPPEPTSLLGLMQAGHAAVSAANYKIAYGYFTRAAEVIERPAFADIYPQVSSTILERLSTTARSAGYPNEALSAARRGLNNVAQGRGQPDEFLTLREGQALFDLRRWDEADKSLGRWLSTCRQCDSGVKSAIMVLHHDVLMILGRFEDADAIRVRLSGRR